MANCLKCNYDLENLETFDNIYQEHNCPNCNTKLYLQYDEEVIEDEQGEIIDCYDYFYWEIR